MVPRPGKGLAKAEAKHRAYQLHLDSVLKDPKDLGADAKLHEVQALLNRLDSITAKIEEAGSAILDAISDMEDLEEEIISQQKISDQIIEIRTSLVARLETLNDRPSTASSCSDPRPVVHGLPKISLPIFDGEYLGWRSFYDQFVATVDSCDMPKVQKMTYLMSSLRGEAKNAVRGMAITSDNYEPAMRILRERFGDPSHRSLCGPAHQSPVCSRWGRGGLPCSRRQL